MTRFYEPDLTVDPNSPFVRDASNKLVRRSYWMDMTNQALVMVMTNGIGANLTNDEKRAHLIDLKREHLIDQVCTQEILPPRSNHPIRRDIFVSMIKGFPRDRLQSCHLWQLSNKESKFHTAAPI